jgi:hypothetical protein
MVDYTEYQANIYKILESRDLSDFKQAPGIRYVYEHLSSDYGNAYLDWIEHDTDLSSETIMAFCKENDRIGSPTKIETSIGHVSATSLRYLYHAHIILSHFRKFAEPIHIVEIGGGYGGLCLAISYLCRYYKLDIQSYTIIDLDEAIQLQKLYLENHTIQFPVEFVLADTYGEGIPRKDMMLISNYCFSEISLDKQKNYVDKLFQKVAHGFMVWNFIEVYEFGFPMKVEMERPCFQDRNKFIFF